MVTSRERKEDYRCRGLRGLLRFCKEPTCQHRRHKRLGFNPWVEKVPWRREWQPTPVFCLENPVDREAWRATVHGFSKSKTRLQQLNTHACTED